MEVFASRRLRPQGAQSTRTPGTAARRARRGAAVAAALVAGTSRAPAQLPAAGASIAGGSVASLVTIGSAAEERARLGQLLGRDSTRGFLLRTPSVLTAPLTAAPSGVAVAAILPEILAAYNSAIPTSDNDGALWAGRGANVLVRGGVALRGGRVTVVLAPEVAYAQNLPFQSQPATLEGQRPRTGSFAAQWFVGPYSADLPIRFGDQSYTVVGLGQSSFSIAAGPVVVGFSTQKQAWGPGVRNAVLVISAAEGVPHAFVRTGRALRTRLGEVEARWILGGLTESLYATRTYDAAPRRALNGAVATLRTAFDPGLTVGAARLVLTPVSDEGRVFGHALDVFFRNQSLGTGNTLRTGLGSDQLASAFARWVFPNAGTEVYGEFARLELPRSVRDALLAPLNTGAYTLGLAHAWRRPAGAALRGSLEFTNLEQTRTFTDRPPPPDYYTGRAAPAGFTNRGQPLGAAIGPGSSSQWGAVDYYAPGWQLGVFAQRTRNQNDALYRLTAPTAFRHDVSLSAGLRGGVRRGGVDARATLTATNRLNYLFQNGSFNVFGQGSVDVRNMTLALSMSPASRRDR